MLVSMTHKKERAAHANELIKSISSFGRRFFYCASKNRLASIEIDSRGKIWFIDDYTGKRIYTHYERRWSGFSHGGTIQHLIKLMRDYIRTGKKIPLHFIAPNRGAMDQYSDMWGYGDDACEALKREVLDMPIIVSEGSRLSMLNDQLSKDALACYKPPFKFSCGYIFDSKHNMFSDLGDLADAENRLARIRGWGKLQYKKNPEALQDKLGELFAQALNEFWGRNQ